MMGVADTRGVGQYGESERPPHRVRITRDFRISRCEVTVGQFRQFVEQTRYVTEAERSGRGCNRLDVRTGRVVREPHCVWRSPGFAQSDDHPVVCVSWQDACAFCQWLSAETGQRCRLPTEAEWEYCCRAGSRTVFDAGDPVAAMRNRMNCADVSLQRLCPRLPRAAEWDDGYPFTAPVGRFAANVFGLHDMHGNVGEWCLDWYAADYYSRSPVDDPGGPAAPASWRVVRGGSWYNAPLGCRASGRHDGIATEASTTNGFRVVVEIPARSPKSGSGSGGPTPR